MSQFGLKKDLIVRDALYSNIQHRDSNAFYAEKQGTQITNITNKLTWLIGSWKDMYPMTTLEGYYGLKGINGKEILPAESDGQYTYPVMHNLDYANEVAVTPSYALTPANLGRGKTRFKVCFKTAKFKRGQIVITPEFARARVESNPVKKGTNFEYEFQMDGSRYEASMPASQVQAGTLWNSIFSTTSEENSYGTGTDVSYPQKVRNQIGFMRKDISWGAKTNLKKVLEFKFEFGGQMIENWMSWYLWNFEQQWMSECEHAYWYSLYNRDGNTNTVSMKDTETGEVLPTGAGLLEQIGNVSTYTTLTANMLQDKLTQAYEGQYDTNDMEITLDTGKGGIREFNRMVETYFGGRANTLRINSESEKFLSGEGYDLVAKGYFSEVHFIDGYKVKVKHNPLFDNGRVAKVTPFHPVDKLHLESYRMVFLDDAMQDGMPNIHFVYKEKDGYDHSYVLGHTDAPKDLEIMAGGSISDGKAPMRSSDKEYGTYTRKKSFGINLRRPNRCFMLEKTI